MTKALDHAPEQLGFALEGMGKAVPVDVHAVRLELMAVLEAMQAAKESAPWDEARQRQLKAEFPGKTKVLPPEEAEFLRRWFAMEMKRIDAMLAAR